MDIPRRMHFDVIQGKTPMTGERRHDYHAYKPTHATSERQPLSISERIKQWPLMLRRVMGHSMVPVLPPQTKVVGWRWFRKIKPGDVIIFKFDGRETIKRVDRYELNRLFVLGDHSETSTDSRHFGAIPQDLVEAKIIWPRAKKQPNF